MNDPLLLGLVLCGLGVWRRAVEFRVRRSRQAAEREERLRAWILSEPPEPPEPTDVAVLERQAERAALGGLEAENPGARKARGAEAIDVVARCASGDTRAQLDRRRLAGVAVGDGGISGGASSAFSGPDEA